MSKRTIRNVAAIGLGTLILAIILFVASNAIAGFLFVAILCLIVSLIAGFIGYIGALIKTAQLRKMGWFVGILLFGVTAALIYGLVGPETQTTNEPMVAFLYEASKKTKRTMGF